MFKLQQQLNEASNMNSEEILLAMTSHASRPVISVGVVQNRQRRFNVYGKNGIEMPSKEHLYEIGSISKVFTGTLLAKAIIENKININDEVGQYLGIDSLPIPTFRDLITHTAGLKKQYPNVRILTGKNFGTRITLEEMIQQLLKNLPERKDYPMNYSNFGLSLAGNALAAAYNMSFYELVNQYLLEELHLKQTAVSDGSGDLGNYWKWETNDGYLPAGGVVSTISDMLQFVQMNSEDERLELSLSHQPVKQAAYQNALFEKLDLRIDAVSMAWMLDQKNEIIWHNGGTDNYNADIRFNKKKKLGVVVLSNLNYSKTLPATVLANQMMKELTQKTNADKRSLR